MPNEDFDTFLWRGSNYKGGKPEYFEDTHDEYGNYVGDKKKKHKNDFGYTQANYGAPSQPPQKADAATRTEHNLASVPQFQYPSAPVSEKKAAPLPKVDQFISPRLYQNIVLYTPKNASDVQRLIDYMRRREPAIVDLDPISDTDDAQRVLDFTSGAVYALGGRVIAIKTNMFLIVPEGIEVAKPE